MVKVVKVVMADPSSPTKYCLSVGGVKPFLVVVPRHNAEAVLNSLNAMTTSDNTEQTNEEVQELTDENLDEVCGGGERRTPRVTSIDFDGVLHAPVAGLVQPVPFTHD